MLCGLPWKQAWARLTYTVYVQCSGWGCWLWTIWLCWNQNAYTYEHSWFYLLLLAYCKGFTRNYESCDHQLLGGSDLLVCTWLWFHAWFSVVFVVIVYTADRKVRGVQAGRGLARHCGGLWVRVSQAHRFRSVRNHQKAYTRMSRGLCQRCRNIQHSIAFCNTDRGVVRYCNWHEHSTNFVVVMFDVSWN